MSSKAPLSASCKRDTHLGVTELGILRRCGRRGEEMHRRLHRSGVDPTPHGD
ncbi:hypothetical protein AKJ09_03938 [Labilithrix luteola]|uniref:Uncharacterized protein n=1 Tax=Labilithrix luteola TaxID=1391654 RepID=A0A0K1PVX8_9BACT|nr:hypothetical protein AKJ09_03938 [Labilithrix luteola]